MITVHQILPGGYSEAVLVEPSNIERVLPNPSGCTICFVSGASFAYTEHPTEVRDLAKADAAD
jgi:hypothetical protein